jgi:hypothetical protein
MIYRSRRNLVVMRERRREEGEEKEWEGAERRDRPPEEKERERIDVWWKGKSHNIAFVLALVMLLRRSPEWAAASLNIRMIVESKEEAIEYEKQLEEFVVKERLKAETETIMREGRDPYEIIRSSSEGADLVFLGIRTPGEEETPEEYSDYYRRLLEQTRELPPTALLMAAEQIDFRRIFDSD